jgi:trehalose-phosphatase
VDGLSYAANHGLYIRHPDGHTYNHTIPDDYKCRLAALEAELSQKVQKHGAWVEYKDLLVAWHYRWVLIMTFSVIYYAQLNL